MDSFSLEKSLAGLRLGPLHYYHQIGSTNDEAARWAADGAPDLSLFVADEQTDGRGRLGRRWFTPAGSALALSLILRDQGQGSALPRHITRLTALGALAVCDALSDLYALQAEIKWPNDVLLSRRKIAGVLAEAHWQGEQLVAVILGIGVNVRQAALPLPREALSVRPRYALAYLR